MDPAILYQFLKCDMDLAVENLIKSVADGLMCRMILQHNDFNSIEAQEYCKKLWESMNIDDIKKLLNCELTYTNSLEAFLRAKELDLIYTYILKKSNNE